MLTLKEGVLVADVDGDCVLLDTTEGRYYAPNRSAAAILSALAETGDREEAIRRVVRLMDADRERVEADLAAFMGTLAELGLARSS